jgi:hypothetical protein
MTRPNLQKLIDEGFKDTGHRLKDKCGFVEMWKKNDVYVLYTRKDDWIGIRYQLPNPTLKGRIGYDEGT